MRKRGRDRQTERNEGGAAVQDHGLTGRRALGRGEIINTTPPPPGG